MDKTQGYPSYYIENNSLKHDCSLCLPHFKTRYTLSNKLFVMKHYFKKSYLEFGIFYLLDLDF